jgi:hypothetical protein
LNHNPDKIVLKIDYTVIAESEKPVKL